MFNLLFNLLIEVVKYSGFCQEVEEYRIIFLNKMFNNLFPDYLYNLGGVKTFLASPQFISNIK